MKGLLVIFASFSGGGKSTIIRELRKKHPNWIFSVSATTRSPRPGEIDGEHYHFVSREQFEMMIAKNDLLEYEKVHDNYYGTPLSSLQTALNSGNIIILDVDVKGALSIMRRFKNKSLSLFIDVHDMDILEKRLRKRGTESDEAVTLRLSRIPEERKEKEKFDYVIINDKLKDAVLQCEQAIVNKWRNK